MTRTLLRGRAYTLINIIGLSIGLACAMLIVLYVKDEVSYDRFFDNLPRIYRVVSYTLDAQGHKDRKGSNTGYFQGPRFSAHVPGIRSFVRLTGGREDIRSGNEVRSLPVLQVDSSFFSVFSFPLLSGNRATCLLEPHSMVLSEDEALTQFGTRDALGKVVMVRENETFVPYTVTAVARRCPQNSSIQFSALVPFIEDKAAAQNPENWFSFFLNTFVVLDPSANRETVEAGMRRFYEADSREARQLVTAKFGPLQQNDTYGLQPLADIHLSRELPAQNGLSGASDPVYSYILIGIALFILLIACINFINLTIARSLKRAREVGIRKVTGSSRRQLVVQFLGESAVLSLFAFGLALIMAQLLLPVFNRLSNKALALSYLFDTRLVIAYVALFVVTSLLAGFYPALVLSGYRPVDTLYNRFTLSGRNRLQKGLVVLQFALASFLIIVTITVFNQFNYLTSQKLGYDDSRLVNLPKVGLSRDEAKLFREAILREPDVEGVTFKNMGSWSMAAKINGDSTIGFAIETVDEHYLPLLHIPVLQGRNFSPDHPSDATHSVLVNEAFVRKAGWKNPIGQVVNFWYNNQQFTVIGVVPDYHFEPLTKAIGPQLFTMNPQNDFGQILVKHRPKSATAALKEIEATYHRLFPRYPYTYHFVDQQNRDNYAAVAKWKQILLFGALLTIFISCIGLFGLAVLATQRRTKEIGIRKVLGASVQSVVGTLSGAFLKLVLIAMAMAMPLGWLASSRWLEKYPYRITPGWTTFAGTAATVMVITLLSVGYQSLRAARASPVLSLRTE